MELGARYLESRKVRPNGRRRVLVALSVAVHGAAVVLALVWGFWKTPEELAPPSHALTLLVVPTPSMGAPAAPIPRAPAARRGAARRELVQPPTLPSAVSAAPAPSEPPGSDPGGDPEGPPGNPGGNGPGPGGPGNAPGIGPPAPQILAPRVAEAQKVFGPMPDYTAEARSAGTTGVVTAKICVSPTGGVSQVQILSGLPRLDESVERTVRTWRYRPFLFNGRAMPFCHVANFVFRLR